MEIRPITFREASDFIDKNHRHHKATVYTVILIT